MAGESRITDYASGITPQSSPSTIYHLPSTIHHPPSTTHHQPSPPSCHRRQNGTEEGTLDWLNRLVVTTLPLAPKALVRRVSSRYIAGDKLADAVRVVRDLNQRGMMATLDILGEFISSREEATATTGEYIQALETIHREKLDSNVSIKLTAFGLKMDFDFCLNNVR